MKQGVLSSDVLEAQFGPTRVEVIAQDNKSRLIHTKTTSAGQILEVSKVQFKVSATEKFSDIHQEIIAGKSMGKAFREHGVSFFRHQKSIHKRLMPKYSSIFGDIRPATVVEVSIFVGQHNEHYADIEEVYSPVVNWPQLGSVLIIDNYDSFTYNLYQQIAGLGYKVQVAKHDAISLKEIKLLGPSHIVISPGPKRPADSGISMKVIKQFYKTIPILGVCLGHQCIGEIFGSSIVPAPVIMHGKTDKINHSSSSLFAGVPKTFMAARYHSLVIDSVPPNFKLTAWSDDNTIMAVEHKLHQIYGIQFHPESFMSEHGESIVRNFLNATA